MKPKLHYFLDPLCGWCYAADPLVWALLESWEGRIELQLHGGGLFPGPCHLSADKRASIRKATARVTKLSGQQFGAQFLNELLTQSDAVWDSLPATRAILAVAESDPIAGLRLLGEIQRRHYLEGLQMNEADLIEDLAVRIGIGRSEFTRASEAIAMPRLMSCVEESRQLMHRVGGVSFPTFALEKDGHLVVVPHTQHYGQPDGFVDQIANLTAFATAD